MNMLLKLAQNERSNKLQMIKGQANPNGWCTEMVVWHHQLSLTLNSMQSK
jgi:hypothetical protein